MKSFEEIKKINEQETYTLILDKSTARLIGFALETEKENYNELIKDLQKQKTDKKEEKLYMEMINGAYDYYKKLSDLQEELKYFYGILMEKNEVE